MNIEVFLQLTINGILLGGLYAAMALGFSTIWGVMRLINLAHGEFLMMGAYVAWFFFNPLREQNLTFTASPETIPNTTALALALVGAYLIWFIVTNMMREAAIGTRNMTRIAASAITGILLFFIVPRFTDFEATITMIAFTVLSLILGFYLSENFLERYIQNSVPRRATGVVIGIILFFILYQSWAASEFAAIGIPMMLMVFVGFALSIGFLISHMIFKRGFNWDALDEDSSMPSALIGLRSSLNKANLPRIWQRRLIGYTIGIILSYTGYVLWRSLGFPSLDPFLSLPLIFILFFALGYAIQKNFLNRLVEGPYLVMLLVTYSIAIILQNIGLQIYAADPRRINVEYGAAYRFGDITVPPTKLFTVILSILMVAGLVAFLRYTRIGYAIRAAAQNKMAARLMGINIQETYAITFAVSIALTAMAGAMMGTFLPIAPINGPPWTLRAFSIVALGGLGKVEGVIAGGLVLGLAESYVGGYVGANWQLPVAFIILVIVLVVRPQGITGGLLITEED